ncbi:MAG TPA: alpha/beta hydrolase [Pseudosphingobacterium sp.]|nr:alpha/beta hydrolase [Pseudosphingobacterium sp.]
MKKIKILGIASLLLLGQACSQSKRDAENKNVEQAKNKETMKQISPNEFTTFKVSDNVELYRVSFRNQYNMNVVGHLFISKDLDRNQKHPAIIVGHPMGAVKEQGADVYASTLAERGFITMAIDLLFWGESDGEPKNAVLPDMYSESFNAAVDYLGTRPFIDRENIGVIGICGSGSFVISAAKIDPRMKAIATISMYDMGAVTRNGYGKSRTVEQRKELIAKAAEQRYEEYKTGKQMMQNYLPVELPKDADPVTAMYWDFYRTKRGIHIPQGRTLETTQNRTLVGEMKFNNFYPFVDIETISPRPLLFIAGDKAHSREFSEDAYQRAAQPKELFWVKDANHVDLYDNVTNKAPFDKLETFFKEHLK